MRKIRFSFPLWPIGATFVIVVAVFAAGVLPGSLAGAEEGGGVRPVNDKIVQTECSACHMAFPAGMLPVRSWQALMSGLDNHFGENAALDTETARRISDYLTANAADAGGRRSRFLRGVKAGDTPLRITETPWWTREHRGEVRPEAFKDPRIGSKANCIACHRGAAKGNFDDD
jgi:mono/diheme cytochrome c family protein